MKEPLPQRAQRSTEGFAGLKSGNFQGAVSAALKRRSSTSHDDCIPHDIVKLCRFPESEALL